MEKQRKRKHFSIYARLLVALLCIETTSAEEFIVRVNDTSLFTNREILFQISFPNIASENLTIDLPDFPNNVQMISMQKTMANNASEVRLWLLFKEAKTYSLPPLRAKIKNQTKTIPFAPVTIAEDPSLTIPRLIIQFDNGKEFASDSDEAIFSTALGEKIYFTVYAQYALRVLQFSHSVLKTSMLSELTRYEIKEHAFSNEKIALARFSWQVLDEGNVELPTLSMSATSYGGKKVFVSSPKLFVTVHSNAKNNSSATVNESENYFSYAFHEKEKVKQTVSETKNISIDDCKKIVKLRQSERCAFFSFHERAVRKSFEKNCGIEKSENERSLPFTFFIFTLAFFFLSLAIIFLVLKKKKVALLFAFLASLFIFLGTRQAMNVFETHGIFLGGTSFAVPNENAAVSSTLSPGMRVRVTEESTNWFYVQQGTNGAWVLHDAVLKIN